MRVFLPVSLSDVCGGIRPLYLHFFTEGRFTNMSALIFVTSIIIFMMSLISEQICQMRFERRGSERIRPFTGTQDGNDPSAKKTPPGATDDERNMG